MFNKLNLLKKRAFEEKIEIAFSFDKWFENELLSTFLLFLGLGIVLYAFIKHIKSD